MKVTERVMLKSSSHLTAIFSELIDLFQRIDHPSL